MAIAILSGLWLTDRHGGFNRAALDTDFDRTLIVKSVLVAFLVVGGLLHDYVLGPRLQRELRSRDPSAPTTRRRLVVVGWFNFGLTIAVPVLGAVVLSTLD
jgi:putative copper export protein